MGETYKMKDKKISPDGITFIKNYEKFEPEAYKMPKNDEYFTMGYGHRDPKTRRGDKMTRAEAQHVLAKDLARFERAVNSSVTISLTQPQFDALVSLSFNIGVSGFKNSKALEELKFKSFGGA